MYPIMRFGGYGAGVILAAAMLTGCGSGSSSSVSPLGLAPSGHRTGLTRLSRIQDMALTQPHYYNRPVHTDHGKSWWATPDRHRRRKELYLYVGDDSTNDVYVYDFKSGALVATLTGFDEPYGMCVDAKGDVYVANFGNGTLIEYPPGAAKPLNIYTPGGEVMGCSVDAKGDVSATSFDPGEVTVYAKGDPKNGIAYSDTDCEVEWAAGYDNNGNLMGVGEYASIDVCALLAGSQSETTLTESGITIDFPGGTAWDGKYIALGDQEAGGSFQSGVWPSTLSGTTITAATGEVKFAEQDCETVYTDIVNPFFLGKDFVPVTPGTHRRAKYMIGSNLWCLDAGEAGIGIWYYPSGKFYKTLKLGSGSGPAAYGVAVTSRS
jgi:hypothetical protein